MPGAGGIFGAPWSLVTRKLYNIIGCQEVGCLSAQCHWLLGHKWPGGTASLLWCKRLSHTASLVIMVQLSVSTITTNDALGQGLNIHWAERANSGLSATPPLCLHECHLRRLSRLAQPCLQACRASMFFQ